MFGLEVRGECLANVVAVGEPRADDRREPCTGLDCRDLALDEPPAQFFTDKADVVMTEGLSCGDAGAGFARFNFATPRPIMRLAVEQMAKSLAER